MGTNSCCIEWRVRRLEHLLRLLCSPVASWEHLALIQLKHLQHSWFVAVMADLQQILPGVCVLHGDCSHGPFLFSSGRFTDEGFWHSAQPYSMSRDFLCRRRCLQAPAGIEARRIKSHIQQTTRSFRKLLHDTESSNVFDNLREKCSNTADSKSELMFAKLCRLGPPIHVALSWAGPPRHQSALSSLFCGDLCFGHYAANFFARSLCSQTGSQRERCEALDLDPHRVCRHCWHCHRNVWLDDESHVLLHCPAHAHARAQLYQQVNPTTLARMSESTPREKMFVLTSCFETQDWEALAA